VGSTFPIIIPLVYSTGEGFFMPAYVMLAIVNGLIGMFLSPLHVCFLLSNQYFGTTFGRVYKHLILPCISLFVTSVIYFLGLHWVMSRFF